MGCRCRLFLLLLTLATLGACSRTADPRFVAGSLRSGSFARPNPPADSLVVASYNIQYGQRVREAIGDLRQDPHLANADLLLLQEMDGDGCARIAEALGFDFVYYAASVHPKYDRPFGNAVLSRWPIVEHRFINLPVESPFPVTARIAVAAEVASPRGGLIVVSLHTSTVMVERETRMRQYVSVRDSLDAWTGPVIVGGDFNTPTYDDVRLLRQRMRDRGYRHVRPAVPTAQIPAWQATLGIQADLDHFFYRGLALRHNGVAPETTASDHLPVWAVFAWE